MLNKKREKPKNKEKKEEKKEEKNNKKENKQNNSKFNNNNILYEFNKEQTYTLDGYGNLKLIEGNLDIFGYSLSKNEKINFDFNEDYPLFKYKNSTNSPSKFEIFQESKFNIYTDIKQLIHASNIPKSLLSLNFNNFSKYLLCGRKCSGKSMLLPYIINRILSSHKNKVYYLECDIIHPLIPFNFAISLIEIKKPIITNIPILFADNENNSYYNLIKSLYIRNCFDIKNIVNVLDILINDVYKKLSNDKSILLINQFSSWDNNDEVLNNYLFKKYFKSDEKSCVLYVKNKYKNLEIISNENKDKNNKSFFEDIILKNENDFYLFGNLFEENKNNDNKCQKIEVETKYEGDDSTNTNCNFDLNNKKKNEEKISILSHFELNNCIKISISLKKIIILFDNPYINELKNNCKTKEDYNNINGILIESLINKYCVILRNNLNEKEINDSVVENYFIDDISYGEREIISYTKIISFDNIESKLIFYSHLNIEEEIEKNKKIILMLDHRIEKVIKKNKNNTFFNALSKAKFSYDITKENETLYLSNGLNYLGKFEEETFNN